MLRGANEMLTHRRVAILEFEYHVVGPWASTDLRELLGWLASLGYSCYWQSNFGVLAPALLDRGCTFPKSWSNLLCAAAPSILAAFESLTRGVTLSLLEANKPSRPCLVGGESQ